MTGRIHVILAIAWTLGGCAGLDRPGPVAGTDGLSPDLEDLAEQSNLVFVGEVTDVTYRVSQPDCSECPAVPYTLATYRIERVLRGEAPAKAFTLRLSGGADGRGGFLLVGNQPTVAVGDQDLLFVTGNGTEGCPLVRCKRGRFRIHQDSVYDGEGVPVRGLDGTAVITSGEPPRELSVIAFPTPSFDTLAKQPAVRDWIRQSGVDPQILRQRYAGEAPARMEIHTLRPVADEQEDLPPSSGEVSPRPPELQTTVSAEAFLRAVGAVVAQTRRKALPVAFLEPLEFPETFLLPLKVAPVISPEIIRAIRDGREVEAFERNNRNPVLGDSGG